MGEFWVVFSAGSGAGDLWAFGEDELAQQALSISDGEMPNLWHTAALYYDATYPLPVTGRRITLGHVIAFACMTHLEGRLRPLARQRRRPAKAMPKHLHEALTTTQIPVARQRELLAQWREGHPRLG